MFNKKIFFPIIYSNFFFIIIFRSLSSPLTSILFTSNNELIKSIQNADGYLIGSPTIGGHAPTPILSALGALLAEGDRNKSIGIFGSYGWSGEALDLLENKLRDSGFKFGFEPIKIKFSPDAATIKTLEETKELGKVVGSME